ncbi:hypothetical protein [Vibrio vulnificus YJ016]|uniref:Uncharacterized protein n=1 Tax=Vibrio vulnificus (strain YJ016) TaxID=196600 RepID=Q7MGE9_VIBVY|nr:hypothetical protein [Vibrio vulnificus YJ016]
MLRAAADWQLLLPDHHRHSPRKILLHFLYRRHINDRRSVYLPKPFGVKLGQKLL